MTMSDIVTLGGDIGLSARAATIETIFHHMRVHAPDNREFQALIGRQREFDYSGGWSFDSLSFDSLLILQEVIERMASDLPAAAKAGNWTEAWKPVFYADFNRFQQKLVERIAQLSPEKSAM
jgi:hypothetical protein